MRNLRYFFTVVLIFVGTFLVIFQGYREPFPERQRENESRGRSGALEALEFWSAARAYPDKDFPSDKYYKAYEYANRTFKKERPSVDAITQWQSIGPVNLAGRTISVAVDPESTSTVYVGSASGGLWRSKTGGLSGDWQRIPTGYPVLGVGAIAIDPTNSNTIYIGTGEVYRYQIALGGLVIRTTRGSFGMGILKTTDKGLTWTKSLDWSLQQQLGVQAIKINPLNPHTLFAATTIGLYKTTDAGTTWSNIFFSAMGEDILINPLDTNQIVYSAGNLGTHSGVHRSTDGGITWNQAMDLPDFTGKTMFDMYASNPNVIFADVADSTTGVGSMWRSTDFGLSWLPMGAAGPVYGVQGWYSHFIAAHPIDASRIFHAAVGMEKSTDGGATFSGAGSGGYADNHAFAWDPSNPDILYVVNDDGVYRSTNFGVSFTYVGFNLVTGQFYNGFSNSATDSLLAIGQVQDHIPGYIYQGSTSWGRSAYDEVGWTAIDQTDDHVMYAIGRSGSDIRQSVNRGVSWSFKASFGGFGAWNSPFVVAPSNHSVLYVGKTTIYKSINGATSFSATNGGSPLDNNPALAMGMSATNTDTVYVATAPYFARAGFFRTTNGGSTWSNLTGSLPDRYPLDIAVDPRNSRIVYATFGGFDAGHVFKTTDAGTSWVDVSATLPNVPTGAALVDPTNSSFLYIGNDIGVFVSTNGGASWSSFSEGLPEAILVSDLSYTPSNRTLRVTTHGNGVLQRKLNAGLPGISVLSPNGGESIEAKTPFTITWGSGLVDKVRIEYSGDDGTSWLTIADNIPSASGTYPWIPPVPLTAQGRIRITSDADGSVADISDGAFTTYFDGYIGSVKRGWNLMSLPVEPLDYTRSVLFPTVTQPAYDYEGIYLPKPILETGRGYWLRFNADQTIAVKGTTFTSKTVDLVPGWNLIGALSAPISISQVTKTPPDLVTSGFLGYDGRYDFVSTLLPAHGYWIKSASPGQLTLSSAAAASLVKEEPYDDLKDFNTLTIIDNNGNQQTLYFKVGEDASLIKRYELPPPMPGGEFDVRFASNRLAEIFPVGQPGMQEIHLGVMSFPITMKWKITDGSGEFHIQLAKDIDHAIAGAGSIQIERIDGNSIMLTQRNPGSIARPTQFSLAQNYPNPFNPTTKVSFVVSRRSFVTLVVYDALGKEVATLAQGLKEPGDYAVSWDAGNLPSGIYVCRMTAGPFTESRKMLLVR